MFHKYTNDKLKRSDGSTIEYLEMGSGTVVVMIPGGGDGLRTVGQFPYAPMIARMFRNYAKKHRFIIMSRRNPIPAGFTMRDFAEDYLWAMDQLGVERAHIETNSAGGPIGQWMAINHPNRVRSLTLGETFAHADGVMRSIILQWMDWTKKGDWVKFHRDSLDKTFSSNYLTRYRFFFPFLRFMKNPKDVTRIIRIFESILEVDTRPYLPRIQCPTLIIGGELDEITRQELQLEMAALIPQAKHAVIPGMGHGENQEAARLHEKIVLDFYHEVEQ